jgi:putative Mn2+ efflux pump MntP
MPVLGWFTGLEVLNLIAEFDHWFAFILLLIAGCRMIYGSTKTRSYEKPLRLHLLLSLSVATSIDVLAVGLSLAFLRVSIYAPVFVIGTLTFALSFLGGVFGAKLGRFFSAKIEGLAGLILIGIGIKILVEHLG